MTYANFLPDKIIKTKIRAKTIFTIFQLWPHKIIVKWVPGLWNSSTLDQYQLPLGEIFTKHSDKYFVVMKTFILWFDIHITLKFGMCINSTTADVIVIFRWSLKIYQLKSWLFEMMGDLFVTYWIFTWTTPLGLLYCWIVSSCKYLRSISQIWVFQPNTPKAMKMIPKLFPNYHNKLQIICLFGWDMRFLCDCWLIYKMSYMFHFCHCCDAISYIYIYCPT